MNAMAGNYTTADGREIGGVVMEMKNITLRFGGVVAIKDISFDIHKGEIRAIIGPNGAGKSSMLNVISGFYHPQEGEVWFQGEKRPPMKPYQVAAQGIARTFQNIALFDGMSVLDNIMTGRLTHMKQGMLAQAIWKGAAEREEVENREVVEKIIDFGKRHIEFGTQKIDYGWIDIAAASAHHQPGQGAEAHGGVHGHPALHSGHAAAVS